mgnify:FL=1|jgi:hypothetical protein|tara:strand:+ start:102 stop:572 length:471 start_codon:yes stop_codon:yes gene_type:complete
MFEVGETVRNVAADVVGVVVEIDGERVYLEQANGAEVDFKASTLVLEDEFQARHGTVVREDAASHANDPVYDEVIRNLYPAVLELGEALHTGVRPVPGVTPTNWGALTSLQKLNAVSTATDVPVQDWVDASKPGAKKPLGPLQLSILANRSGKPRG